MIKKEQELIRAILIWDNEEATEAALALIKGISQQLDRSMKKMLCSSLKNYRGKKNRQNRIDLKDFIPYMRKESEVFGTNIEEFLTTVVLYHLHPQDDDNYIEFNKPLGGFDPQTARARFQELLKSSRINRVGKPMLFGYLYGLPKKKSTLFFLQLIGECPEGISMDESLRLENITALDISELRLGRIPFLHKMTALTYLDCNGNELKSLDVSRNTALIDLNCSYNKLTNLDLSKNIAIKYLDCSDNGITSLDISQNIVLSHLDCNCNNITSLDLSQNTELLVLLCYYNLINSLDLSKNTKLDTLVSSKDDLDLTQNTALTVVDFYQY